MAVQSSGLETLAEALLQQGFCATDELGFSVIYQRPDDSNRRAVVCRSRSSGREGDKLKAEASQRPQTFLLCYSPPEGRSDERLRG